MKLDEFCQSNFFRNGDLTNEVNIKSSFKPSFLSINIQLLNQAPDLIAQIKSQQDKLNEYRDIIYFSNDRSLHFTFVGIARKEDDSDLKIIKTYVEPYLGEIKKIIEEEKIILNPFSVCLKYTKATAKSIFYFCAFPKNLEDKIAEFQKNVCNKVFELIKREDLTKLEDKNNIFGNPINFVRWKVPSLTNKFIAGLDSRGIYTKAINEEQENREIVVSKGKLSTISLTYSDQFWTDPDRNIIENFTI